MRRLLLYGRSRALWFVLLGLVFSGLLSATLGSIGVTAAGRRVDLAVPLVLIIPLLAGSLIGSTVATPFGEVEEVASYPLPRLRVGFLLALLAIAALFLVVPTLLLSPAFVSISILRNLVGYTGLGIVGAWLMGHRLAWTLPIAFYWIVLLNGLLQSESGALTWAPWAWPHRPADDRLALLQAGAWLLVGLALVAWRGTRRPRQDSSFEDAE